MDLSEFLLARIAEDEAVATAASERPADAQRVVWYRHDDGWTPGAHGEWAEGQALFDRFDPARVLAECEAKRRIVESRPAIGTPGSALYLVHDEVARQRDYVFRLLALPYADHPDYLEEWKP